MRYFNHKLNVVLEEVDPVYTKAIKKFAHIWNSYAEIDVHADPIEHIDEYAEEEEEPIYLISLGQKWGRMSQNDAIRGDMLSRVAEDIALYVQDYYEILAWGWTYDRGGAVFRIGKDGYVNDDGGIMDVYHNEQQYRIDKEESDLPQFEREFMAHVSEATELQDTPSAPKLRYETLVDDLKSGNPDIIKQAAGTMRTSDGRTAPASPFAKRVLDILYPEFSKKIGKYGVKTTSSPPPWYGSSGGIHKMAEKRDGFQVTIELHDAEQQFPQEIYQMLMKSEHPISGRPVAWASGYQFEDILAIIELQSDVMRQAPQLLVGEYEQYRDELMEGFADWQDAMLQAVFEYAKEKGISRVKIPTARKLGRFWRGARENPNMRVLKTLYDKKLRNMAHKEQDWWVIDI